MTPVQKMRDSLNRQREMIDAKIAMLDELLADSTASEAPPPATV